MQTGSSVHTKACPDNFLRGRVGFEVVQLQTRVGPASDQGGSDKILTLVPPLDPRMPMVKSSGQTLEL